MKFFLEFASCCGCAPPRLQVPAASSSSSCYYYGEKRRSSFLPRRRGTLRPTPSCRRPRYVLKRRRVAAPARWRPTLVPIFEEDEVDSIRSEKHGKRMSDYDYNSRRGGASKIITPFYPMPYMF